jgi:hypothetical protein
MCDWTTRLAPSLGLSAGSTLYSDSTMCQQYTGPLPSICPASTSSPITSQSTASSTTPTSLPSKIIGGYVCGGWSLTASTIANAGFNLVMIAFMDV